MAESSGGSALFKGPVSSWVCRQEAFPWHAYEPTSACLLLFGLPGCCAPTLLRCPMVRSADHHACFSTSTLCAWCCVQLRGMAAPECLNGVMAARYISQWVCGRQCHACGAQQAPPGTLAAACHPPLSPAGWEDSLRRYLMPNGHTNMSRQQAVLCWPLAISLLLVGWLVARLHA
jgi:hypothetical protein